MSCNEQQHLERQKFVNLITKIKIKIIYSTLAFKSLTIDIKKPELGAALVHFDI
jgi:hypothetical protein